MALLAVEGAIDDIAGVGQRSGELAIQVGIVLDHEEAQGSILHSRAGIELAIYGINGHVNHSATAAEQSQHIDEFVVLSAEASAHHFGVFTVLAQRFDGLAQRNRLVVVNGGALFRPCEARTMGRLGPNGLEGGSAE